VPVRRQRALAEEQGADAPGLQAARDRAGRRWSGEATANGKSNGKLLYEHNPAIKSLKESVFLMSAVEVRRPRVETCFFWQ